MTLTWREHIEALDELRAAAHWYEDQREGLGDRILDAVGAAVDSVLGPSLSWSLYKNRRLDHPIYSRSVTGFPFDIVYLRLDDAVYVIAYAHERRLPGYWRHRQGDRAIWPGAI